MERNPLINKTHFGGLLLLLFIAQGQTLKADEYHYNTLLIGDRAAGLGGAYTAIADDPSGLFYNPAGVVHAVGGNISGSMNALHTTNTTYKNVLGGRYNWTRESSNLLPSFFGVFQPLGEYKVGFSYAVLDSILENQDQTFNNFNNQNGNLIKSYTINFNNQDNTYNIGPSFAMELNEQVSFGLTLYYHYRTQEQILHEVLDIESPALTPNRLINNKRTDYYSLNEYGIRPAFGLMYSPMPKLSLGAMISKTVLFSSEQTRQSSLISVENDLGTGTITPSTEFNTVTSTNKRDYPLSITAGAAYFYDTNILFSGDLSYYAETGDVGSNYRQQTVNFALGAEYYWNSQNAIRAGFYSNNAATPELKTSGVSYQQAEHVDLLGIAASYSTFTRNTSLTFGFNYSWGQGEAQLFATPDLQQVEISTFTVFLGANYNY